MESFFLLWLYICLYSVLLSYCIICRTFSPIYLFFRVRGAVTNIYDIYDTLLSFPVVTGAARVDVHKAIYPSVSPHIFQST